MFPRIPVVQAGLKNRMWAIIVLVTAFMIYLALGDLIPKYWDWVGFRSVDRSILTLGFVIILLLALSGLAMSDRLAILAIRDGLTDLYNQTYIKARLQEEIDRSGRYKHPVSVLMIDLDDFKAVNDKFGHVVGDRALKAFAGLLQETIRTADVAGRYGGEEFIVLLPQTSCLDAAAAAERIRKEVAFYPFRLGGKGDKTCQFTISIGVYSTLDHGQTVNEIINLADAALYRAKNEGKNKVVVFVK